MAIAIQTCQCENSPFEMTKSPVHPMSSPIRHIPNTSAITATGVKNAETTNAASCDATNADCNRFATFDVVSTTAVEVRAHAGWRIPPILITVIPSSLLCRCILSARSFGLAGFQLDYVLLLVLDVDAARILNSGGWNCAFLPILEVSPPLCPSDQVR